MKKPIQQIALIAGNRQERDRLAGGVASWSTAGEDRARRGCRQCSANRVWIHGSSASAAPCSHHGPIRSSPLSRFLLGSQQRPDARQRDHAAEAVGIHGEAVKDRAGRSVTAAQPNHAASGAPRDRSTRAATPARCRLRRPGQEDDDAVIAGDGERRRDERGQTRARGSNRSRRCVRGGGSRASAARPRSRRGSRRCGGCSRSADRRSFSRLCVMIR